MALTVHGAGRLRAPTGSVVVWHANTKLFMKPLAAVWAHWAVTGLGGSRCEWRGLRRGALLNGIGVIARRSHDGRGITCFRFEGSAFQIILEALSSAFDMTNRSACAAVRISRSCSISLGVFGLLGFHP